MRLRFIAAAGKATNKLSLELHYSRQIALQWFLHLSSLIIEAPQKLLLIPYQCKHYNIDQVLGEGLTL